MKKHLILRLLPLFALWSLFFEITGSSLLGPGPPPILSGPGSAFLGSRVVLRCSALGWSPPLYFEVRRSNGVLVGTYQDDDGQSQPASFLMKVSEGSSGPYHCKVSAGGETGRSNNLHITVVTPPSQAVVTSDPSPAVLFQGSRLVLSCEVRRGSHLSYTWFHNRKEVSSFSSSSSSSSSSLLLFRENQLVVKAAAPVHAGNYSCVSWSSVGDIRRFSSSTEIMVKVRVLLSKPQISFSVFKDSSAYHGNVSCWASTGSPPVNISLSMEGREVGVVQVEEVGMALPEEGGASLAAWFLVGVVPGLDVGVARCRMTSEFQELQSDPLTLEVVPVGGEVKVEVQYLFTSESHPFAALLTCLLRHGSFPLFTWTLNGSALPAKTHLLPSGRASSSSPSASASSILLARLSPAETGFYRCQVRDEYDPTGQRLESPDQLVNIPDLQLSDTEKITVSFCCFLLLILALCSACVFHMLDQQAAAQISPPHSDGFSLPELSSQSGMKPATAPQIDSVAQNHNRNENQT